MADALIRRPDFKERHSEDVSRAKHVESSTLASLRVEHETNTLASDINESYIQEEHFRLLKDQSGGRKVTLSSHLKAMIIRFSYSDGLLWHKL